MFNTIEEIKKKISWNYKAERKVKEVENFKKMISKHTRVGDGCDYTDKKVAKTFVYTTLYDDRRVFKKNDRFKNTYHLEEEQPVTMTGLVYKMHNKKTGKTERVLHIGIARHNTTEHASKSNAEGFEVSRVYAEQSPDVIMRVSRGFNDEAFETICNGILEGMRLKIMRV